MRLSRRELMEAAGAAAIATTVAGAETGRGGEGGP